VIIYFGILSLCNNGVFINVKIKQKTSLIGFLPTKLVDEENDKKSNKI